MKERESVAMLILLCCSLGRGHWVFWPQLYIFYNQSQKMINNAAAHLPPKTAQKRISVVSPSWPSLRGPFEWWDLPNGGIFQMEIQESPYNLKSSLESMDCMSRQGNYLDLKFEDNGDYYLINSFLGLEKNDGDGFLDECIEDAPSARLTPGADTEERFGEQVVREAAAYLCFRTTSLRQIMDYLAQYYGISQHQRKTVLAAARRLKLQLKRTHARLRRTGCEGEAKAESLAEVPLEIKVEQSQLSPFVFEEESQETRKKKRNRMSAQNSRDRKKEYIRQIQNQNRELKRRLAHAERTHRTQHSNREFLKMILCLGITCYTNLQKANPQLTTPAPEKIFAEEGNCHAAEHESLGSGEDSLPCEVRLLNPWQQGAIADLMQNLGEGRQEKARPDTGFECTDLISQAASERSTSSEGGRKSHKSQCL